MTDHTGNVILTCEIDVDVTVNLDAANAAIVNQALSSGNYARINIAGNSVPSSSTGTIMPHSMTFEQFGVNLYANETGTLTINEL